MHTNSEFAAHNRLFLGACAATGLPPTTRQASKWRNGKGQAFKTSKSNSMHFMLFLVRQYNEQFIGKIM